jgi:hypothetical protein
MKTLQKIYEYVAANWDVLGPIALGIIELILRALPTKRNYSILDFAYKLIKQTVPNKRIPNGNELITSFDKDGTRKNSVNVRTDRHIVMIIIFMLLSIAVIAQNPNNQFNGMYLTDPGAVDTTFIKNTRANIAGFNGNTGGLMFDKTNNKYRVWNPGLGIWSDWNLFNPGGLAFWPLAGTGTLTNDVIITGPAHDVTIEPSFFNLNTLNGFAFADAAGGGVQVSGGSIEVVSTTSDAAINAPSGEAKVIGLDVVLEGSNNYFWNAGGGLVDGQINRTLTANMVNNRLTFFNGATGITTTDSDLTFTGGNTLNVPIISTGSVTGANALAMIGGTGVSVNSTTGNTTIGSAAGFTTISSTLGVQLLGVPNDNTETQLLTVNPGTNLVEYRTVASLPLSSLTATQIGFGSGSNLLSGETDFTYENVANTITVGPAAGNNAQYSDIFLGFNNGVTPIGGLDYSGAVVRFSSNDAILIECDTNITIDFANAGTADLIVTGISRTGCGGAPAGAVYNNGDGILRICP